MYHHVVASASFLFFFNDPPPTDIYTLSLHDALPISTEVVVPSPATSFVFDATSRTSCAPMFSNASSRSEEHTSELQSRPHLVCRLLLEKKKKQHRLPRAWPHVMLAGCLRCWSPRTHR